MKKVAMFVVAITAFASSASLSPAEERHKILLELICREHGDQLGGPRMEVQVFVGGFRARRNANEWEKVQQYNRKHPGDRDHYGKVMGGDTLIRANESILDFDIDDGEVVVANVLVQEKDGRRLFDSLALLSGHAWSQWESGRDSPGETDLDLLLFLQHNAKGWYEQVVSALGLHDDVIGVFTVRVERINGKLIWSVLPGRDSGNGALVKVRDDGTRDDGRRLFHMTGAGVFSAHVFVK